MVDIIQQLKRLEQLGREHQATVALLKSRFRELGHTEEEIDTHEKRMALVAKYKAVSMKEIHELSKEYSKKLMAAQIEDPRLYSLKMDVIVALNIFIGEVGFELRQQEKENVSKEKE